MTDYSYSLQTVPTDDAKKSTVSHTILTYSIPDLPNIEKEEDLTESIGVVLAKDPSMVKSEKSYNNAKEYELLRNCAYLVL